MLRIQGNCRHCGREFTLDRKSCIPFHDYPIPTRRVCPGSKEPPFSPGKVQFDCMACDMTFEMELTGPEDLPKRCPSCGIIVG
jgi:DNA-directed RNA polymerase subunit RPC12/RpoP